MSPGNVPVPTLSAGAPWPQQCREPVCERWKSSKCSAQLRYLASQHQLKVQGSAPGSLCSGCGIVDRELQLIIETELQLWCFMTLSLSGGCCRQFSAGKAGAGCGTSTGIGAAAPAVPGQQVEATVPGTWLWEGSGGSSGSAGGLTQMPVPDMSRIYLLTPPQL